VGSWKATTKPANLQFDVTSNMARWEPWVRASVLDFELLSKLRFTPSTTVDGATLESFDSTATALAAAYKPLATIIRPDDDQFHDYLIFLDRYADLRPDRVAEIMTQMGGALAFLSSIAFLHPARTPYTLELLAAALRLANFAEMRFKHTLACRRPNEFSAQVQPIILTPSHGSFPSGHATESFTMAVVLWEILKASGIEPYNTDSTDWGEQLARLAARVATNRTVAGVHFPVDSAAGAVLGITLGLYFVKRCDTTSPAYDAFEFDGTQYPTPPGAVQADGDFYWQVILAAMNGTPKPYITKTAGQPQQYSPLLNWLWGEAVAEWS